MMRNFTTRIVKNYLFLGIISLLSILLIVPLGFILSHVITSGISAITPGFFTHVPKPVGEGGGGILNALIGSAILLTVASILAIPFGIFVGIFLAESRPTWLAQIVRVCVEILQGTPSIVIGIVAYVWIVVPLRHFSAAAGAVALGFLMLPIVIRTTEETIRIIPASLKEASLALGVPYYRTMLKVIIPAGFSGIMTGIVLSIARVSGETAPLLFTAFGSAYVSVGLDRPISALPLIIFNYALSPYDEWHQIAWGAALVLVTLVLGLSIFVKGIIRK